MNIQTLKVKVTQISLYILTIYLKLTFTLFFLHRCLINITTQKHSLYTIPTHTLIHLYSIISNTLKDHPILSYLIQHQNPK
jgi:hypothetical protein